jgi:hypothetical protein
MRVSETRRPFATAGRTVFGLGRMAHAPRQPCARHSSNRRKTTPRAGRLVRTSLERARTFAFIRDTYRIFAFTIEVYPKCCDFYVPDEVIQQQTDRLNGAVMYLLDHSDCPYEVIGQPCS